MHENKTIPIGTQVRLRGGLDEFGLRPGVHGTVVLGPAVVSGEHFYVVEVRPEGQILRAFLLAQEIELAS